MKQKRIPFYFWCKYLSKNIADWFLWSSRWSIQLKGKTLHFCATFFSRKFSECSKMHAWMQNHLNTSTSSFLKLNRPISNQGTFISSVVVVCLMVSRWSNESSMNVLLPWIHYKTLWFRNYSIVDVWVPVVERDWKQAWVVYCVKLSDSSESTVCLWFTLVLSLHELIAIDVDGLSMSRL